MPRNADRSRICREILSVLEKKENRKVLVAQRVTPPKASVYHSRGCDRLAIPIEGEHRMRLYTNGKERTISAKPGEFVWMPTGSWNLPLWDRKVTEITMIIYPDAIQFHRAKSDGSGNRTEVKIVRIEGSPPAKILHVMEAIRASRSDDAGLPHLVHALCLIAIDHIKKPPAAGQKRIGSKATYLSIAMYIQESFCLGESRAEVASHFGITPNHLSRLFQEHTGSSFTHRLNHLKLSYACDLLLNTELRIKEIAGRCGFQDANYFCRVFKKRYGRTPINYRLDAMTEQHRQKPKQQ